MSLNKIIKELDDEDIIDHETSLDDLEKSDDEDIDDLDDDDYDDSDEAFNRRWYNE